MPAPVVAALGRALAGAMARVGTAASTVGSNLGRAAAVGGARGQAALSAVGNGLKSSSARSMMQSLLGSRNAQNIFSVSQRMTQSFTGLFGPKAQPTDPTTMPGLTASQRMGMMGQSAADIQVAHEKAQIDQSALKDREAASLESQKKYSIGVMALGVPGVLVGVAYAVKKFGYAVHNSNESLRNYNGTIAAAFIGLEHGRIVRAMGTGAGTAATTAMLARQIGNLEKASQPWQIAATNVANTVATVGIAMMTTQIEILNTTMRGLISVVERIPGVGAIGAMLNPGGVPEQPAVRLLMAARAGLNAPPPLLPLRQQKGRP